MYRDIYIRFKNRILLVDYISLLLIVQTSHNKIMSLHKRTARLLTIDTMTMF